MGKSVHLNRRLGVRSMGKSVHLNRPDKKH